MPHPLSDIVRRMNKGTPVPEIARALKVSPQALYKRLERNGIEPIQRKRQREATQAKLDSRESRVFGGKLKDRKEFLATLSPSERKTFQSKVALLYGARIRARNMGMVFSITYSDLEWPTRCPVLGIPIDYSDGKGRRTANSPSLDRLRCDVGYTPANTRVISWRANKLKSDATADELAKVAAYARQAQRVRK